MLRYYEHYKKYPRGGGEGEKEEGREGRREGWTEGRTGGLARLFLALCKTNPPK